MAVPLNPESIDNNARASDAEIIYIAELVVGAMFNNHFPLGFLAAGSESIKNGKPQEKIVAALFLDCLTQLAAALGVKDAIAAEEMSGRLTAKVIAQNLPKLQD
jgi:hypothetical protein